MTTKQEDEYLLYPKYLKWTFEFSLYFVFTCVFLYWADDLLLAERRFKYDFSTTTIGIALIILAILGFHELGIFIRFLKVELTRKLYFSPSKGTLRLAKGTKSDILELADLKKVIFSERRFSSRSPTTNLEYSELFFKSGQSILITSYIMDTKKLEKFLGNWKYKKSYRNRGKFEGIKKSSTAANNA